MLHFRGLEQTLARESHLGKMDLDTLSVGLNCVWEELLTYLNCLICLKTFTRGQAMVGCAYPQGGQP